MILDEWKQLLDSGDTDLLLRTAAQRFIDIVEPSVRRTSEDISMRAADVTLICRCVVKRAFDAASAILSLTGSGASYNALALLRPTCEDFFFVGFLRNLPREEANRYVVEKARLEIREGLLAQEKFFPKMRELFGREGDPPNAIRIGLLQKAIDDQRAVLRALGSKLGWGASISPTVKYMAERADAFIEYDFFYRGASSSVHASLHHLLRMVWGDPHSGVFSISNKTLERYYARFAVIYGIWLLGAVMQAAEPELPELHEALESDAYAIWLATLLVPALEHSEPGIVTTEELQWEGPPLAGA